VTDGLDPQARYYFVHSFFVQVDHEEDSVLKARYGVTFDAAIAHANIFGAQFHPEKKPSIRDASAGELRAHPMLRPA